MNPSYQRQAARIRELIEEGESVARLERDSSVGRYIAEYVPLHAWLVKAENIIENVFGSESVQYRSLRKILDRHPNHAYEIRQMVGVLTGALDDLESGFLQRQEHLVASEIFDSLIEKAKHLVAAGYKDPAAVLGRVIVEDSLRRLCRAEGLNDSAKAASLNESLRDSGRFSKPQWRLVQAWLDIGNAAAHGKFSEYSEDDVGKMLTDVEAFLAQELA